MNSESTDALEAMDAAQKTKFRKLRESCAFFITSRMVTIRITPSQKEQEAPGDLGDNEGPNSKDELVKGRVFVYDDSTKILILKLWDDQTQAYTGMAVYNANNVELVRIHALSELPLDEEQLLSEFTCTEDSYNRVVMDRNAKLCND